MGMMGSLFLIPIFAQTFLGYTATQSGYLFMPMAFAMMLASPIGGRLVGKVEPRYVIAFSTTIAAIGLFLFSVFLDPRSGPWDIMIPLFIMAFGLGFGMAQRTNIIASAVPHDEIGAASGILALVRNIAGAFGIAIFGTILTQSVKDNVLLLSKNSILNTHNVLQAKEAIALITLKAQILAYSHVFIISSTIVAIGAIGALWIIIPKDKISHEEVFVD